MRRVQAAGLAVLAVSGACHPGPRVTTRRLAPRAVAADGEHTILVPLNPAIRVGDTLHLSAMTVTADGRSVSCAARWQTFNPDVVQLLADGRAIGLHVGSATVTANCASGVVGTTLDVGPRRRGAEGG